jgi:hypothetical protein
VTAQNRGLLGFDTPGTTRAASDPPEVALSRAKKVWIVAAAALLGAAAACSPSIGSDTSSEELNNKRPQRQGPSTVVPEKDVATGLPPNTRPATPAPPSSGRPPATPPSTPPVTPPQYPPQYPGYDAGSTCAFNSGNVSCDSCLATSCCSALNACFGDADCSNLNLCIDQCRTLDSAQRTTCETTCFNAYPAAAAAALDSASSCVSTYCSTQCGS